jgi:REP element-mobilizing transposase RayT
MERISPRPRGRDLRKGRWSQSGQVYLITAVTVARRPLFAELTAARQAVRALHSAQVVSCATTLAFVVMPDHVHWLAQLQRGTLSEAVRVYKATVSAALGRRAWQRGFHDRALRRQDDVRAVARYIVANPLRAGLVRDIGDYPHWDAAWL